MPKNSVIISWYIVDWTRLLSIVGWSGNLFPLQTWRVDFKMISSQFGHIISGLTPSTLHVNTRRCRNHWTVLPAYWYFHWCLKLKVCNQSITNAKLPCSKRPRFTVNNELFVRKSGISHLQSLFPNIEVVSEFLLEMLSCLVCCRKSGTGSALNLYAALAIKKWRVCYSFSYQ